MSALAVGMLVQHASLGVGKVVAVEAGAVHVFFPRSDQRHAAKFHLASARTLLTQDGVAPDEWLEGLSSFSLDPVIGRWALSEGWLTHPQAIARFVEGHPEGFTGDAEAGPGARCAAWRAAAAEWARTLGGQQAATLLADGEVAELGRRAARAGSHLAALPDALDADALADALADEATAAPFLEALVAVVAVPSPARARFERLFDAAEALDVEPAAAWPLATVFPFLALPARCVFLSPRATGAAAERLGCNLRLTPGPSWAPYAALRALETKLVRDLAATGARDFVEVEAFLHELASDRSSAAARRRARPARAKPVTRAKAVGRA